MYVCIHAKKQRKTNKQTKIVDQYYKVNKKQFIVTHNNHCYH